MNATIISNNEKHYPVLLNEILSIISPQNGGTFIDCTFGQGGYSNSILKFPKTKIHIRKIKLQIRRFTCRSFMYFLGQKT